STTASRAAVRKQESVGGRGGRAPRLTDARTSPREGRGYAGGRLVSPSSEDGPPGTSVGSSTIGFSVDPPFLPTSPGTCSPGRLGRSRCCIASARAAASRSCRLRGRRRPCRPSCPCRRLACRLRLPLPFPFPSATASPCRPDLACPSCPAP